MRGDIAGLVTLTLSGGAYGVHARRSESTAHRRFYIAPLAVASFLHGGRGLALSVSLYARQRRFWYACQQGGRRSARIFVFLRLRSIGLEIRWGEGKGMLAALYPHRWNFGMHATGSEWRVRMMTICFMPSAIPFSWCEELNWACRWLPVLGGCASGIHASG